METTGITWRERVGASRPEQFFSWQLVPFQEDLDDVTMKMLMRILLILQCLPFLASSTF